MYTHTLSLSYSHSRKHTHPRVHHQVSVAYAQEEVMQVVEVRVTHSPKQCTHTDTHMQTCTHSLSPYGRKNTVPASCYTHTYTPIVCIH